MKLIRNYIARCRDASRRLFKFWDGCRWQWIDPMTAYRGITGHPTYRSAVDPAMVDMGNTDATVRMVQAGRDVFGVTAFDQKTWTGLTEGETIDLMVGFGQYIASLKKSGNPSPTGSEPAASPLNA